MYNYDYRCIIVVTNIAFVYCHHQSGEGVPLDLQVHFVKFATYTFCRRLKTVLFLQGLAGSVSKQIRSSQDTKENALNEGMNECLNQQLSSELKNEQVNE